MNITLDYRNPTPSHCDVAIFVNGAFTGQIRLRQEEIDSFQHIISQGMTLPQDEFLATGNPGDFKINLAFAKKDDYHGK
jgi:hypothetical protein